MDFDLDAYCQSRTELRNYLSGRCNLTDDKLIMSLHDINRQNNLRAIKYLPYVKERRKMLGQRRIGLWMFGTLDFSIKRLRQSISCIIESDDSSLIDKELNRLNKIKENEEERKKYLLMCARENDKTCGDIFNPVKKYYVSERC